MREITYLSWSHTWIKDFASCTKTFNENEFVSSTKTCNKNDVQVQYILNKNDEFVIIKNF